VKLLLDAHISIVSLLHLIYGILAWVLSVDAQYQVTVGSSTRLSLESKQ
jgi:hypothetical protein